VGGIYELAGPDVLTPNHVAEMLGHRLGRDVHAEQTSIESWRQRAEVSGLGAYQVDTLVKMFNYYDHCGLWGNSRILEKLVGRPATRFHDFLERTIRSRSAST
jgi:hypothetical protein